ncbi:LysR family transcriptional regulator [Tepidimonas sp.]|uniref:LysR family transcriptional regulator n=1 Tax=Tepidimonas sp. TaxID=2002775 RepID=UPI002FE25356
MSRPVPWDSIDIHLIRVLHTVLTERSVTRAAVRLGMHQPAVSAALRRLRRLTGDPLLVRTGAAMVPTAVAQRMIAPAAEILRQAETMLGGARAFDPPSSPHTFAVAASDYLDSRFLPRLVARVKAAAPLARQGLARNIVARCPHFGLIPAMVSQSLLVLTTGRQYCQRFLQVLPVAIVEPPLAFPRLLYYQLWHDRTHGSPAAQWLRQTIREVAAGLADPPPDGQTPLPSAPSRRRDPARAPTIGTDPAP